MPFDKKHSIQAMLDCGVVAVIRAPSTDVLPFIADALIAGGVINIEVTMSTPDAIAGIEVLTGHLGDKVVIGVGTVLDVATAREAISAGAAFVVSPMFDAEIVAATLALERISMPGAYTPTEIVHAAKAGADIVKVFPATTLGPGYFKDLLAPLPHLKLTPTGGVDATNAGEWIKAGAVCVGAGSSLVSKTAISKKDWPAITASARAFVEAVRSARFKE